MISDHVGGASIDINIEDPPLIHFGRVPPGAIFEHHAKTYMHRARDPVNFQMLQSRNAQKRASAKVKVEHEDLIQEA